MKDFTQSFDIKIGEFGQEERYRDGKRKYKEPRNLW